MDKTASLIAKKSYTEEQMRKSFESNEKFSFLKENDPYRAYFDMKIKELSQSENNKKQTDENDEEGDNEQNNLEAPPADKFTYDHGTVTVLDNDIIKHTAQFVAQNGEKFLISLTEREKRNPQFQFLKPDHVLFPYFTHLIDAYSRIINLDSEDKRQLMKYAADKQAIFNDALKVFEFESAKTNKHKKREEIEEDERSKIRSNFRTDGDD